MPLYTNDGGITELVENYCNDGGVTQLEEVYCNDGGITYELFGLVPHSLTWGANRATINSTASNGLTLNATTSFDASLDISSDSHLNGQGIVYTRTVKLYAGTVIRCNISDLSGHGTAKEAKVYINSGEVVHIGNEYYPSGTAIGNEGYTVPATGEYHLSLIGHSYTVVGSQSGVSRNYYPVTATINLVFTK